jgi:phosphohistidine phosphatase SixA
MRRMLCRLVMLSLALVLPLASPAASQDAAWTALKQGHAVALVRHAQAPGGAGDPPGFRLDDCATQRNLSSQGRAEARELGARFRAQNIPVAKVLTSQWCRCRETAELMNLGTIEEAPTFNNAFVLRERRDPLTQGARAIVAGWKGPGALVVVTHGANIWQLTGIQPAQAEAIVVAPDPNSDKKLRVLGRIAPLS